MDLYTNIKQRRLELGLTQQELAEAMGYADKSMIAKIEKGSVDLPLSKVKEFARVLHTTPSQLMGWDEDDAEPYYLDPEAAEIAQEVYDRPELKMLFDASRKASKEDLSFVVEMLDRMYKKERGED